MLVPAVLLRALQWVMVSLCRAPKEREETLVPQAKESLAEMENQAYQVCRGLLVPKDAREKLELQELAFQDHRVKRDQEGSQDL